MPDSVLPSSKTLAIVGPNGIGKTRVAYELARRINGEVVNLDTVYLFRGFEIVTGLADTLKEQGVPRHLYQLLDPDEELIPAAAYAELVKETCAQIRNRGKSAIIEGGSTSYLPALAALQQDKPFVDHLFVLRYRDDASVRERTQLRLDAALDEGLLDQIRWGDEHHPDCLVMQNALSVGPFRRFLHGEISREKATADVVDSSLAYADLQRQLFSALPSAIEIEHTPGETAKTVEALLALIAYERGCQTQ